MPIIKVQISGDDTGIMNSTEKRRLANSLNRIEGHIKGIKNMIRSDRCISDIMLQLSAVRAGVAKTQIQTLKGCIDSGEYTHEELTKMLRFLVQSPSGKRR